MFGKFFKSTFTGSMMASGAEVFAVWAYVIAHAVDARVELNARLLAAVIGAPVDRIEGAIEALCAPDPASRNKEHEGRRMIREGQFQYFVTGHMKYRQMRDEDDRREYNRLAQAKSRAKRASADPSVSMSNGPSIDVNMSNGKSIVSANTEAEAEAETEEKEKKGGSLVIAATRAKTAADAAPHKRGTRLPDDWELPVAWGQWVLTELGWSVDTVHLESAKFADFWHGKAGKDAAKRDWQATWRNWCRNARPSFHTRAQAGGVVDDAARRAATDAEAKRLLGFNTSEVFDG